MNGPTRISRVIASVLALSVVGFGCSMKESPEAAKQRLQAMADKGRIDGISDTNFVYCAFMSDIEAVKAYVNSGMDVNVKNQYGRTPLIGAAGADPSSPWSGKNEEVVKFLIANGADVNARDESGESALGLATKRGRTGVVKLLKDAGATE